MERDVAIVAKKKSVLIVVFAASFAKSAVETTPTFLQDDFSRFSTDAVRVVALPALRARN